MKTTEHVYTIYFDPELNVIRMEWQGYATSIQFREGTELMLNLLIRHKCDKVLADIRDMILIGLEDRKWLETNFLPRAIKFGFKTIAIIAPKAYFNKVAIEDISFRIDKEKLSLHIFDELDKGIEWLKNG